MHDLVGPDLVFGAVIGLLALAGLLVVPALRPAWAGLAALSGTIAVLGAGFGSTLLLVGAAMALGAGILPEPVLLVAVAVGGAGATLAAASPEVGGGPLVLLTATAVVTAVLAVDLERRRGAPAVAVLVAGSAVGMFLTAPDTDALVVILAVLLAVAAALVLRPPADEAAEELVPGWQPLPGGMVALLALLLWALAEGGRPRPGSVVGGVACLGLLVLEPVVHRLVGDRRTEARTEAVIVIQAVVVVVASRVVGFREGAAEAAVLAVPLLAAAALALVAAGRLVPERSS